jgi:putative ABC transport system permease protein
VNNVLRHLAKNPGFAAFALVTLALGIGANTTSFTVLNRLLLQSLPYRDPGQLVQIWATSPRSNYQTQAPGDFVDERAQNNVFESMAAYYPGRTRSLAEPGQAPVRVLSTNVTAEFFPTMRVQPQLGRLFTSEEENKSENLVLLSNSFWHEHYGSDPAVIGRNARIDAKDYTIVGVMPAALDDATLFGGRTAFWPLDAIAVNTGLRDTTWYTVAARLKPGISIGQAQAAMEVLAKHLAHDYPKTNGARGFNVVPFPRSELGSTGAELAWLVLALSGMVLLIACINLANLQLVRTTRRAHEFGIRLALGCSRSRLIFMLLAESLIVSGAGGVFALIVAAWTNEYVAKYFKVDMPLDLRVLGFTFLASMATGAVFGTVPAWLSSRVDISDSIKPGARGATSAPSRRWLRQSLVVVELTLAITLLAGAGFFVSGIYRLTHQELGWNPGNQLVGFIELDPTRYGNQGDPRSLAFGERMKLSLQALPGVQAVAFGLDSPAGSLREQPFRLGGEAPPQPGRENYARSTESTPGYLGLYGIRIVKGRDFRDSDNTGAPKVVIVNETMAKKYWPG